MKRFRHESGQRTSSKSAFYLFFDGARHYFPMVDGKYCLSYTVEEG